MTTWQISERDTNKILKEFDVETIGFSPSLGLEIRPPFEYFNFDSNVHYICKAGEVLVSEEELETLKSLKEKYCKALIHTQDEHEQLQDENAKLKSRIAELEQQLEAKKEPEVTPGDEVEAFYKAKIKELNRLHGELSLLTTKMCSSGLGAIAHAAPIAALAAQIAQISATTFNNVKG